MVDFQQNYRQIHDPIHGFIKLSSLACRIVDTQYFQRLRNIHQLGTCHYVFPSATHTRFEHSIGTYYLTDIMLKSIKLNSDPEIINKYMEEIDELKDYYSKSKSNNRLDQFVCELIKIAGLCHDLGHGPFSHLFDDVFLADSHLFDDVFLADSNFSKDKSSLLFHETRSTIILRKIVENDPVLKQYITDDCLNFIQKLINPGKTYNFIFQIVSNSFNGIDVDKFDYMARDTHMLGLKFGFDYKRLIDEVKVLDNKLCFPEKMNYEVASIFQTRYRLHKQIYSHRSVVSIQFMMSDMMKLVDSILNITKSIFDIDKFNDLTDDYILIMVKNLYANRNNYNSSERQKIEQAYNLYLRIVSRNIYYLAKSFISEEELNLDVNKLADTGYKVDPTNVVINKTKIGFVSGNKKNPMDSLYFYNPRDSEVCINLKKEQLSKLIPDEYQEHLYMIFVKDRNDEQTILELDHIENDLNKFRQI